ncbi:MAG: tryptophan 7-halogenase [Proteobacteria bacterium]|nr:tryptophan 7-halogenase [Pseudomonadota bacterium]
MNKPNTQTQVLVIGGGPAGSTAATLLARNGIQVTLIEREVFPRYHIGESLLPSCLEIVELLGARELLERQGFQRKPGAFLEWKGEQWSLDFGELRGNYQHSYQVPRAEFDEMLLRHAAAQGVTVCEGTSVREIVYDGERPVAALWEQAASSQLGEIRFDWVIDASGRNGIIANRYLNNRRFHEMFKNVAIWGYWDDVQRLPDGREGAIAVGSIDAGWIWAIPFSDGRMSVGVVLHKDAFQAARRAGSLERVYRNAIASSPLMTRMTAPGRLNSALRVEQDYSYVADRFCGPGFMLAGDAACFLDPLLSTGVHLAMLSGLLAAAGIGSVLRHEVTEAEALAHFDGSYRESYLRLLVFVAAFYETRGKEGYFAKAETLSHFDADPANLRRAFLNLVSGLEDLADAEQTSAHLMGEMQRRIRENLELRRDKTALRSGATADAAQDNARFFDGVEGFTAMSPEHAQAGLYVANVPHLHLARVGPARAGGAGRAGAAVAAVADRETAGRETAHRPVAEAV